MESQWKIMELIMTFIASKNKMDEMIKMMVPKDFEAFTSQVIEEDDGINIEDDENHLDDDDGEGSEGGSESNSFEDPED